MRSLVGGSAIATRRRSRPPFELNFGDVIHGNHSNLIENRMPDKVFENIYRIVVPLPKNPLQSVNSYVIKTVDRDLIIDTGMNLPACRMAMESGLKELDVDLNKADLFITHLHSDHIGLASHFMTDDTTVYFNRLESDMMRASRERGGFAPRMLKFAHIAGFSKPEIKESLAKHPGLRYHSPVAVDFTILEEGDTLEVGEYRFEIIHTPGHSEGHLCLYDAASKLMIAGDHVLGDISPNISSWSPDENPLDDFLVNLDKVHAYDVELALPGHRSVINDFRGRVDELREHHHERLDEVLGILNGKPMSGYEVASEMTWRMRGKTWPEAGIMQKWFATGEAIAHLYYLESRDRVKSESQNGVSLFTSV